MLELTRPIVFFDLETTGIDVSKDRIVEISLIKIMPNGDRDIKTRRINPTIPIPAEASSIHKIMDKDVADCPEFSKVARSLYSWIEHCDLGGFNSNRFDIPLLIEEFGRAGISIDIENIKMIDVQTIYHKMEPRTLSAAYKFYCNKEMENAHSAQADVEATYDVLLAQLEKYEELPKTVVQLDEFCKLVHNNVDLAGRMKNNNGVVQYNFGKYRGQSVKDVHRKDSSYYDWIKKGDFPLNTKEVLRKILFENSTLKI